MARKLTKARYAKLEALLADHASPPEPDALAEVLRSAPGVLVARAARLVIDGAVAALAPDLEAAYERLHQDPLQSGASADPGCRGKLAVVDALRRLDSRSTEVFTHAAGYAQLEPAWGEPIDSAVPLRCAGAAGLVEINHPQSLVVAAGLLADPEALARRGAAECLASLEGVAPAALLRLKALTGDAEPEVLQACLASLLTVTPDDALDFVCRWLHTDSDSDCEAAAFALAGARTAQSLERLIGWHRSEPGGARSQVALTAIALARLPRGFDYLFDVLDGPPSHAAGEAIEALAVYAPDADLRERALSVLEPHGDASLIQLAQARL